MVEALQEAQTYPRKCLHLLGQESCDLKKLENLYQEPSRRLSYEEQIGGLLKEHQMPNAVIQISGGQLQLQEEKVTPGLTMKALQESTLSFFKARPEFPNPEKYAREFIDHIKLQRGGASTTTLRLKKLKGPAPV